MSENKPTAVAILAVHDSKQPQLVVMIVAARMTDGVRRVFPFVAIDEDAPDFLIAPDFEKWSQAGAFRKLRTRGLDAKQKSLLHRAFISQQLAALAGDFQVLEVSANVSVQSTDFPVTELGKNWGMGWKVKAAAALDRFVLDPSAPFEFLLTQNANMHAAYLGVGYLAARYHLDDLTQAERELGGTDYALFEEKA